MNQSEVSREISKSSETPEFHIDEFEERLAGGLRFANLMCSVNQEAIKSDKAILHSLVEVLISKGVVHLHELDERKAKVIESLNNNGEQTPNVHLVETADKYAAENQVVAECKDCLPVCRAVCCKFWFALSVQDLEERILKWDYSRPYGIAQGKDGYCAHLDRSNLACTIYQTRPLVCRTYDCRHDPRIWRDFEKKVLNPDLSLGSKMAKEAK
jgi:hypothetical protein